MAGIESVFHWQYWTLEVCSSRGTSQARWQLLPIHSWLCLTTLSPPTINKIKVEGKRIVKRKYKFHVAKSRPHPSTKSVYELELICNWFYYWQDSHHGVANTSAFFPANVGNSCDHSSSVSSSRALSLANCFPPHPTQSDIKIRLRT